MKAGRLLRALVAPPMIAAIVGACGPGGTTTTPTAAGATTGAGTTVEVTLQEWAVVPGAPSTAGGDVTFVVMNAGPEDVHEFVIVRTDLDPGALPTDETGAVVESGQGIEVVDEIEDIPVGETQEVTANLGPGSYALICNIYDETEQEAHYQLGMRVGFEVQG
jgi:uncharacterized cupredoxin-like copper-binding protein